VRSTRNSSPSSFPSSTSRRRSARANEIASWANAASALAIAGGLVALTWSRAAGLPAHGVWIGLGGGVLTFVGLRFSLAHRLTVWIAAAFGTLTIAALGGGLAWLFAHVVESPSAPSIAAVVGAVLASLGPAWSYAHLAHERARPARDSMVPSSVPRSG
jgi:hypothetical protein